MSLVGQNRSLRDVRCMPLFYQEQMFVRTRRRHVSCHNRTLAAQENQNGVVAGGRLARVSAAHRLSHYLLDEASEGPRFRRCCHRQSRRTTLPALGWRSTRALARPLSWAISGGGLGRRDRFDDKAIFAAVRVGRPPAISRFVAAVIAPKPRGIEFRHRHCIFPQLEQRLQRAARGDFTVVVEFQANDLKHAGDSRVGASAVHTVHCGSLTMPRERAGPHWLAFYRGDRGVCGAPSRDRHLVCAYPIIVNKRITRKVLIQKRQPLADDSAAAKLGSRCRHPPIPSSIPPP
jgi:hypothetical protein